MKQGLNPRRSRGRGNPRGRHPNTGNRNHQLDSNGPEGRIRGSAAQILERYLALARDAQSSGDTVAAENLFQHAEHYFRLLNANGANGQNHRPRPAEADDAREDDEETDSTEEQGRLNGGPGEGWRQPRARDDRHVSRDDDRNRQSASEPQRQRDAAPSPAPAEAGNAAPRPAATGTGQGAGESERRASRQSGDLGEHRPAFLRRRLPASATRQDPPQATRQDEPGAQGESAAPTEAPLQAESSPPVESHASGESSTPVATAQTDQSPAAAPEEKLKPRARRRRTASEGEEPVRAPRRRTSTKRAAEEERAEGAEGRDLETSA